MQQFSPLQKLRLEDTLQVSPYIASKQTSVPLKVGVLLSGGMAPGGHNVLLGLQEELVRANPASTLTGFLGGPSGLLKNKYIALTKSYLAAYRNQGGFDALGTGRTKIETAADMDKALDVASQHGLDALVFIGGDDTNTNSCLLAQHALAKGNPLSVIGVPKTIDGDLRSPEVEMSFGFDTAVKTYAELVGNICRDSRSAGKYYHFIRLMGRSASHITLDVALQTQVNLALISEEVAAKKQTLPQLVDEICDLVTQRAAAGKNYGVILVPEGIVEFIPHVGELIAELSKGGALTVASQALFDSLPADIAAQLLADRDPHGNVQVSLIDSERLLALMVAAKLGKESKFDFRCHFLGYEGRSALPSFFDAHYGYALGLVAAQLAMARKTGVMAAVTGLGQSILQWKASHTDLAALLTQEVRHGKSKTVIKKALVDLQGPLFKVFSRLRENFKLADAYLLPGPIQFYGPKEVVEKPCPSIA